MGRGEKKKYCINRIKLGKIERKRWNSKNGRKKEKEKKNEKERKI